MEKLKEELCKRDGLEGLSRALGVEITVDLHEHQPNFGPELEPFIRINCGGKNTLLDITDAVDGKWDNMDRLELPDGRKLLQTVSESDVMTDIITDAFSDVIPKNIKQFIAEEKKITDINVWKNGQPDDFIITADLVINDAFLLQLGTDGYWSIPSEDEVSGAEDDEGRPQRLAYIYLNVCDLVEEVDADRAVNSENGLWLNDFDTGEED